MSKIMKVVYQQECSESSWDGSNSRSYMGEESWSVGEMFNGEFIKGKITDILYYEGNGVEIQVGNRVAMFIPYHAVNRIYYGE